MFEWLKNWFKSDNVVSASPKRLINYTLNDPTTPTLCMQLNPPTPPQYLLFNVIGYKGGGYTANTIEGQAANNYVTIANSIKLVQGCASKPIRKWAATNKLQVVPRAGRDLNAYYDRSSLKFFYIYDPALKKTVYSCDSADVVSHELGHALLDCQKPGLWNSPCLEGWGFHEGYADINAIMSILNYKPLLEYVLKETGNNLRKDSVVTRLAEEMAFALADLTGQKRRGGLRDAINNFIYTPPERLPQNGNDDELTGECHSFGRLFLGAWYEILVNFYESRLKTNKPLQALVLARDAAGIYLLGGIAQAPVTTKFYNAVAAGMISYANIKKNTADATIMREIFQRRKILQPKLLAMSNVTFQSLKLKNNDEIIKSKDKDIVITKEMRKIRLVDHLGLTTQTENPLFGLEVEIPTDVCYHFDKKGMLTQQIQDSWEETIEGVRVALNYLHNNNLVSGGPYKNNPEKTSFEVKDGKLLRTKFID